MSEKINWTNTTVKLGELKPWSENPKMSTRAQAKRILDSWQKFGQVMTVAISPSKDVYDGHQRLSALLTLYGPDYAVDARQSNRHLTDDERRAMVLALTNATGSWNWEALSGWQAEELKGWGFDKDTLKGCNNDVKNLQELIQSEKEEVDAEPEPDRAGELQEKWNTQTNQVWQLGEHRLFIGDCTVAENVQKLTGDVRCGACVTDSPYGINREGIENDDPEGLRGLFDKCLAAMPIDNGVIINFQSPRLFPVWLDAVRGAGQKFERALWMYKSNDETFPWRGWIMSSEIIILSSIGKPEWADVHPYAHDCYVYKHEEDLKMLEGIHTTVKPTVIVQDLISRIGGDVYEPFAGSGTTIIASHNLGRRCFAMELSDKYAAVILERFYKATDITPVLVNQE
jgi:hypothetical protein